MRVNMGVGVYGGADIHSAPTKMQESALGALVWECTCVRPARVYRVADVCACYVCLVVRCAHSARMYRIQVCSPDVRTSE